MIGTLVNVAGILIGGILGLTKRKPLSTATESWFKLLLGVFTVFYGLRLTWISLHGPVLQILKQLLIAVLALMLGKLVGQLLHLQKMSNRLGQVARQRIAAATPNDPRRASAGFKTSAALFCAAPLGIFGAIQDGLSGYFYPLAVKGLIEGLATMGFVSIFGWGVLLSALPVLVLQGSITLLCVQLRESLLTPGLIDSINAAGGLLVFSVALVILELKKISLADYLPSLAFAPLITWLWR
jgi:uncharacterized membrane protein YqgA involved in biofilm formation